MTGAVRAIVVVLAAVAGYLTMQVARPGGESVERTLISPTGGEEVVLVLLVSPDCMASNSPDLPTAWAKIVTKVAEALPAQVGLRRVGVALSRSVTAGGDFLEHFGQFDELLVGGRMSGIGSLYLIHESHRGPAAVPQIVVMTRSTGVAGSGRIAIGKPAIVARATGLDSIDRLANRIALGPALAASIDAAKEGS